MSDKEKESGPSGASSKRASISSASSSIWRKTSLQTLSKIVPSFGGSKETNGHEQKNSVKKNSGSYFSEIWSGVKLKKENKFECVTEGLKVAYRRNLKPLEEQSRYYEFFGTKMDDSDFDAVPMILVIGQYSTGKSTFLKYLIGEDYPGINIGPEPTTDKFTIIMHGEQQKTIQGDTMVYDEKLPFKTLAKFGSGFMNRLQCATLNSDILHNLVLVDTPGILAGQQQRTERGYDVTGVFAWFAARVDRILLLFDAHKLDISDEMRSVINAIKPYDDKLRVILNKSDSLTTQHLLQVYGALMWTLGKALHSPEVIKVYKGSFWDLPYKNTGLREVFDEDQEALIKDLKSIPSSAAQRKINRFAKQMREVKIHALIINQVLDQGPDFFTIKKKAKKREVIANLQDIYDHLKRENEDCSADFPDIERMRERLHNYDWSRLKVSDKSFIEKVTRELTTYISEFSNTANNIDSPIGPVPKRRLRSRLSMPAKTSSFSAISQRNCSTGGLTGPLEALDHQTPFGKSSALQSHKWSDDYRCGNWFVATENPEKYRNWVARFRSLNLIDGKIAGHTAKDIMKESNLNEATLSRIWNLSDVSKDGLLDESEFCLAMFLIDYKVEKQEELPSSLPDFLHPINHINVIKNMLE